MRRSPFFPLCVFLVFAAPASAGATDRTWPGTSCASTLQACIDASASGDAIHIATNGPIDEDIALGDRGITLDPAVTLTATYKPAFSPGRSISGSATASGIATTIRGIRLVDGSVELEYHGSGTASYEIDDMILTQTSAAATIGIGVRAYSGSVTTHVNRNRITGNPEAYGGSIELLATGGTLDAYAAFNHVEHRVFGVGNKKTGIQVQSSGGSGDSGARLFGNEVILTDASSAGITFDQYSPLSTATLYAHAYTNVVRCNGGSSPKPGLSFKSSGGGIDVQAVNNTIDTCPRGIVVAPTAGGGATTFGGVVGNNVVVSSDVGLSIDAAASAVGNDYNLINAPSNAATLGSHSITAPAQLGVATRPRLAAGSPGIDAADTNLLANGIVDNGLPTLDADGLRRMKGVRADIGAYEFGDIAFTHVATAANTGGHVTYLDDGGLGAAARLIATRLASPGLAHSYEPFGVWQSSSWTIYNEDHATAIAPGKAWSVFAPASGAGAFAQVATAANTNVWYTQIDNVATNGLPNRIVLARHNYSLDGAYDNHPISVFVGGSGSSARWHVANADRQALAANAGFNVYAQAPSPNAFRVSPVMGSYFVVIDHPLVNRVECAALHVTRVTSATAAAIANDFIVEYTRGSSLDGYWVIRSPVPFPADTSFNVVIEPAQVALCSDVIFADGFDPTG